MKRPKRKGLRGRRMTQIENINSEEVWLPVAQAMTESLECLNEVKTGLIDLGHYSNDEPAIGIEDDVAHTKDDVYELEKSLILLCEELDKLAKRLGRKS